MANEENYILEENEENSHQEKSLGAITNSYYNDNSQEMSKIYISNNKERITEKNSEQIKDNLNISSKYRDSNYYKDNLLESEEIFINQKKEIQKTREKNFIFLTKRKNKLLKNNKKINLRRSSEGSKNGNINIYESKNWVSDNEVDMDMENNTDNDIILFSLNDNQFFEISLFDYDDFDEEKPKIPEFNEPWKPSIELLSYYSKNEDENKLNSFIEFNRLALRSTKEIDYSTKGLELNINLTLMGEGEFWIFTRSFVNKSINESFYFDEKSANIEENDNFNKYCSVIKIRKERNSNKCFVIFGTFYQEENNHKLYYKSFLKRQLIDFSDIEKIEEYCYFYENDKCEFDIYITDLGEEIINTKIFLNNKKKFNDISGKFFLPINKKAKLLIYGTGKSIQVKDLKGRIFDKKKSNIKSIIQFESDNEAPKNCECCSIL